MENLCLCEFNWVLTSCKNFANFAVFAIKDIPRENGNFY